MDILSYILSRKYVDKAIKKLKKETAEQSIDKEVIKDIIKENKVDSDIWKAQGELGAKNLLKYPYSDMSKTRINDGVSFTLDDDNLGQLVISGTYVGSGYRYAYRDIYPYNKYVTWLKAGTYILSAGVDLTQANANYVRVIFRLYDRENKIYYVDATTNPPTTPEVEFTITDEQISAIQNGKLELNIRVYVNIPNSVQTDVTFDNIVVKPMIRLASDPDDTWQPYAKTNKELTDDVKILKAIPIDVGEGENSIIEGAIQNNNASGMNSHAEGSGTQATAGQAHAEGDETIAKGTNSHAEGQNTRASNVCAHVEGMSTTATGAYGHAEGQYSGAIGTASHAEGTSTASGYYSHSQNRGTSAQGYCQTTIGKYNVMQGSTSSLNTDDYALIIGNGTDNDNRSNALAVQWDGNVVFQDGSKMKSSKDVYKAMSRLGAKNLLSYPYDQNTTTSNGITYTVQSDGSILINGTSTAYSFCVLKRQEGLLPKGSYIISFNAKDIDSAQINLSIGLTNQQTYAYTTKVGINKNNNNIKFTIDDTWDNNYTEVRISINSNTTVDNLILYPMIRVAEDTDDTWTPYAKTNKELTDDIKELEGLKGTVSRGAVSTSVIEGDIINNIASKTYAHAEGQNTKAQGTASHAEGGGSTANAQYSHAEGYYSSASGQRSHAQNAGTLANGFAQTAIGKYNVGQGNNSSTNDTDYALIIGNGEANARSNALAIQWDGTVVFQDGTTLKSMNDIKQLVTDAINEIITNYQPPANNDTPSTSTDSIVIPELDDTIVTRELPEGYTQIPYVRADGNQYVSTYVKENKCSRAEYEVALTEEPSAYGSIILSSKNFRYPYPVVDGQEKILQSKIFNRYNNINFDWNLNQRYKFDAAVNGDVIINGVKCATNTQLDDEVLDSKVSLSLLNDGGEPSNKTHYFIGKLYYCKLYDNNNNILKDYVPCINSEGVVGLYETVTNKFVTSVTSSPFLAE